MPHNMAEGQEEIHVGEDEADDMDYRKMKQTHETVGYREGLESGKEANLQQGFNQGFIYGANMSKEWGKLRGVLSALMSFASSKSAHDISPQITAEIIDLFALISQMEKHTLDAQAMQDALENKMNQHSLARNSLELRAESFKHQKAAMSNNTEEGNELSSAFQMLHTQDRQKGVGNLGVQSETIEDRVETKSDLINTALPVVSSHSTSGSLEVSETVLSEVETLWPRIVSLAEKIGVNGQKILSVKTI